ncbi:MAG: hypothetical protein ABSF78_12105 [Candidatus Acidiferrales bacterium]
MKSNADKKELLRELGHAINEAVSESEGIARVISKGRTAGLDLALALNVTVTFEQWPGELKTTEGRFLRSVHLGANLDDSTEA